MAGANRLRVGFIGIGNMGWPMAANIQGGGFDLTVFDLDTSRASRFAQEFSVRSARSLEDLADRDVVITMLPNGRIVREVLLDADEGAFIRLVNPGTVVVDMSSSEPTDTQALGEVLAAKGVHLVDAPVSGGVARAEPGTLAIMIGTDESKALDRVRAVLETMGAQLFETGKLGSGHATKALNNLIAATSFMATSEAMLIARRFGLDLNTFIDVVNVSTGHTFMSDKVMKEHVIDGAFSTGFAMGLLVKDVAIAHDLGRSVNLDAPLSRTVLSRWQQALSAKAFGADNSEAIQVWDEDLD